MSIEGNIVKNYDEQTIMKDNILALNRESLAVQFDLNGSDFEAIENIGSGAYGVVCSAVNKKSGARVAIKKISDVFAQPIIAMRTYREIKILRHFKHENIIGIKNILHSKENERIKDIYIVFNLMETDLHRIIYSTQPLTLEHVRYFLYQIVRGLKFIHSANILHRDLKPSNLLVNENCDLKIGDFGMARGISSVPTGSDDESERQLTHYVATRWYRAPELLLQYSIYSTGVDLWSVGCILAELINRRTLFPGRNMLHQLELIFNFFGVPSNSNMDLSFSDKIKRFIKYKCDLSKVHQEDISSKFPGSSEDTVNLLSGLLQMDSNNRLSAQEVLEHSFLKTYHDPSDEPTCPRLFDFEQEFKKFHGPQNSEKLSKLLEESIEREIDRYKYLKDFPAIMMNLSHSISSKNKSSPEITVCFTDINNNDQKVPENDGASTPNELSSTKNHEISFSKEEISPKNSDEFCESPLSRFHLLKPGKVSTNSDNSSDVDMLSAKLGSSSIKDVEMPSPVVSTPSLSSKQVEVELKSLEENTLHEKYEMNNLDENKSKCEEMSSKEQVELADSLESKLDKSTMPENQVLDAKAKIKAALLFNSELKKERMRSLIENTKNIKQPITALQRQKEREVKRRLKQERAQKKKEKHKDEIFKHSDKLSSDDKKLLERWNNMQKHLKVESTIPQADQSGDKVTNHGPNDKTFAMPLMSLDSYVEENLTLLTSNSAAIETKQMPNRSMSYFTDHHHHTGNANFSSLVSFPIIGCQTFPPPLADQNINILRNENLIPNSKHIYQPKNYHHDQNSKDKQHQQLVAKKNYFANNILTFNPNNQSTVNSLPTISTILPCVKNRLPSGLRINKEVIKFADIKESQESAPLSATLLADWIEMTDGVDFGGILEEAVLDFEHAPTKINLCYMNSPLLQDR